MTTELEQKFYDTFEIEKRYIILEDDYGQFQTHEKLYPRITAEKLLEMICIYNSTYTNGYTNYFILNKRNVEELKEQILKNCLMVRDDVKSQIQQLFND
jgi:hypothetical protein